MLSLPNKIHLMKLKVHDQHEETNTEFSDLPILRGVFNNLST